MELHTGVLKLRRLRQERRADEYDDLRRIIQSEFEDRLIPIDAAVALTAAGLAGAMRPASMEWKDLLIAASAMARGLTILTRNTRHFTPAGVTALDPLAELPPDPP